MGTHLTAKKQEGPVHSSAGSPAQKSILLLYRSFKKKEPGSGQTSTALLSSVQGNTPCRGHLNGAQLHNNPLISPKTA